MNTRISLLLSLFFAAVSSCTIEKRLYTNGFHVEFRKPHREPDSKDQTQAMTELWEEQVEEIRPDSPELSYLSETIEIHQASVQTVDENLILEDTVIPEQSAEKRSAFDKKTGFHTISLKKSTFFTNPVSAPKEKSFKKPKNDSNYSQFWEIMGFVGILAGLLAIILLFIFIENPVCLLILQFIVAGLVLAGLVWLIIALCRINIKFQWFWSGR